MNKQTKKLIKKNQTHKGTKKQFLFNPENPKKSFDVYIDKNPKDTILHESQKKEGIIPGEKTLTNIMQAGFDEFKKETGRNMTYCEMRELYG